jgi:branched-chain amino acid aminotransferase
MNKVSSHTSALNKDLTLQVYVNGKWVPKEEAKVSIWDHGFLYGDGIFEGIRVYQGIVFKLKEHLKRLYASASAIDLTIPYTPAEMQNLVVETVRKNNLQESYIRLVVSRGAGDLGIDPRKCKEPTVMILADRINLYPEALYATGIRVMIASTRRNPPDSLNGRIKSLNYLNNILAKLEHIKSGLDEAIMLNHAGYVVEGTAENVFIVKDRKLLTPPCYLGALEGITRQLVIELAPKLGLQAEESLLNAYDLYASDEIFLTGTGAEIVPVVEVDGRKIGNGKPGSISLQVLKTYREYVAHYQGVHVYPEKKVGVS